VTLFFQGWIQDSHKKYVDNFRQVVCQPITHQIRSHDTASYIRLPAYWLQILWRESEYHTACVYTPHTSPNTDIYPCSEKDFNPQFQWCTCLYSCAFVPLLKYFPFITFALRFSYSKKLLTTCWPCSTVQKIPSIQTISSVLNVTRISMFPFYRIYSKSDFSTRFPSKTWTRYSEQNSQSIVTDRTEFQSSICLLLVLFHCCGKQRMCGQPIGCAIRGSNSGIRKTINLYSKRSKLALGSTLFSTHHGLLSRSKAAKALGLSLICT
jgi:hypothetical protein